MNKVPKEAVYRQIFALIPVYMNVLMMGCAFGWLPNATYLLLYGDEVHATSWQCALISCFSELGKIVCAFPAGILVDKYGRKNITISAAILHVFAWCGISLSTSMIVIYTGRFFIGFGIAMVDATAPIVVGEVASPEIRGRLNALYQIFMVTGMISTSLFSVFFSSYQLLSFGITFLSFVSLLTMYWMAETPSYLVSISQPEEAKNNLSKIRAGYPENEINEELEKLNSYIREEKSRKSELSLMKFFKLKSIRKPLIVGTLLNFCMYLPGGGIIFGTFTTVIFPSNEYVPKMYYPLIGQLFVFFLSICASSYIDKFPRRTTFLSGAATMIVSNAICMLANYSLVENQDMPVFQWILLLGNITTGACFGLILLPMINTLRSELYPQAVKGFGGSLGVISQALALIIILQLYTFFLFHSNLYFVYGVFSLNAAILYIFIYFYLPETLGVMLVDLQIKFKEKSSPCNEVDVEKNNNR